MFTEKVILVCPSISQWSGKIEDKKATKEIEDKYGAKRAGNFQKKLMIDYVDKISKEVNKLRIFHYNNTLTWGRSGVALLPCKNYFDYMAYMIEGKEKIMQLVNEFKENYTQELEKEKIRLGGLFDINDYPKVEEITDKYNISIIVEPVPSNDFTIEIEEEELEKIRKETTERVQKLFEGAIKDIWQRLYNVVFHMVERLKEKDINPKSNLHKTIVGNIKELCELLPKLNFMEDKELEEKRKEIEEKLTKFDVEELKEDEILRKNAIKTAEEILEKMKGYI